METGTKPLPNVRRHYFLLTALLYMENISYNVKLSMDLFPYKLIFRSAPPGKSMVYFKLLTFLLFLLGKKILPFLQPLFLQSAYRTFSLNFGGFPYLLSRIKSVNLRAPGRAQSFLPFPLFAWSLIKLKSNFPNAHQRAK